MCGIFGSIALGGPVSPDQVLGVERGTDLLKHRGPDGAAVVTHGQVCFGHRRLSIVDLQTGSQPMWSADHRGLIAYNGEVYNFEALERDLAAAGRRFVTRSDTEAVLNAYLAWGPGGVSRLRGMFAFAAVDFDRKTALLARDRLGKKPLFYTVRNGLLTWSSELEPLYRTVGPFEMDLDALDDYLAWQYVPAPRTIYRDVRCLPPGHYASIDLTTGKIDEHRYWRLEFSEDRSCSAEEWGERLDAAIRDAVKVRFMSDVPFGAFLSGGIDSSLVVGYMAELMQEPVKTFTIGFNEADFSEMQYAEQVARINGTEHHVETVEAESLALLPLLVQHYGQPFADSSAIPTYYVSRMAARHVKMVLSGDGGDENFAGYNSYEYVVNRLRGAASPSSARGKHNWFRDLAAITYHRLRRASRLDEVYQHHAVTAQHFPPAERRHLLRAPYRNRVRDVDATRRALLDLEGAPIVTRLQHLDFMAYLPFDILTKVDVAAMANSLEVRVPLLDHHVVELAATMPSELKLKPTANGFDKKHILKNLAKRRYPAALIDRPKMGFGVPIGDWMADKLRDQVERRLRDSKTLPRFFDMPAVETLWRRHVSKRDGTAKIWNLLFLEEWLSTHVDALPDPPHDA
ncbi:MAG: asparagine synthase (glutamine-hydrolyzing) [Acidobacteriota bacterium]|nr:asparagine synthase (glutamine-hydrolyzing) [Acidobacteriota bacterium]